MPRIIKPTKIEYKSNETEQRERSRQRQKHPQSEQPKVLNETKVVNVDNSRRAKILAARKQMKEEQTLQSAEVVLKINQKNISEPQKDTSIVQQKDQQKDQQKNRIEVTIKKANIQSDKHQENAGIEEDQQKIEQTILLKPIFMNRQYRNEILSNDYQAYGHSEQHLKEEERKKKAIRHTTNILLQDNMIRQQEDQQQSDGNDVSDDDLNHSTCPTDNDNINEEYEYELWKIRELKRIRRDAEQRQKAVIQKAELDRRRLMNNEEIMLENRKLGSDITDHTTETKYVFMQKYYHKGAFYQDSTDQIFKRDYNLPTPLEMQDKSMLPEILQKRKGNFGMRGQSKYTHLTNEDTTNFDPQYRPDQSILQSWKKKTGGYKSNNKRNI